MDLPYQTAFRVVLRHARITNKVSRLWERAIHDKPFERKWKRAIASLMNLESFISREMSGRSNRKVIVMHQEPDEGGHWTY